MIHSKTIKLSLLLFVVVAVVIALIVLLITFGKTVVGDAEQQETIVDTVGLLGHDVVHNYSNEELE